MKTHELLSDESKWTKGTYSKDELGNFVYPRRPEAVCWCIKGAMMKCYPDFSDDARHPLYLKLLANVPLTKDVCPVASFNDKSTFKEVHDLLVKLDI